MKREMITDAALRLGLSYWATRDLLTRGALRGGRDGRNLYIESASVDEWLAARSARPGAVTRTLAGAA